MSANGRHNADELLIAALAAGSTYLEAAKAAKVGERTARRRMEDAEFRARVSEARAELVASALGRASGALVEGVDVLIEMMRSAESESVRLAAVRALFQLAERRPVGGGLLRLTTISPGDHVAVLDKVVNVAALPLIPPELHDRFFQAVEGLAN